MLLAVCYRAGALIVAFMSGWGFGSTIPTWKLDRWNEYKSYWRGDVVDLGDFIGMYRGCGSAFIGALADLRASCSTYSLIHSLMLVAAFVMAIRGWPPYWLNPAQTHPVEYLAVSVFQRWIWYTIGGCALGLMSAGAYHSVKVWSRRR